MKEPNEIDSSGLKSVEHTNATFKTKNPKPLQITQRYRNNNIDIHTMWSASAALSLDNFSHVAQMWNAIDGQTEYEII